MPGQQSSYMLFSGALILTVSQVQTQQVMTSLTRSYIEYLLLYSFAHFVVKIDKKSSLNGGF